MERTAVPPVTGAAPAAEEGVGDVVHRVVDDAKAFATAQVDLYKTLAAIRLARAKVGIVFVAVAAVLAIGAIGALLVGLILSLATLIGPLGATAVVVLATLAVAGILGWLGAKRLAAAMGDIG